MAAGQPRLYTTAADLEIGLNTWSMGSAGNYAVNLRYMPDDQQVADPVRATTPIQFDFEHFQQLETLDLEEYGRLLGRVLFGDADIYAEFKRAYARTRETDTPLRVRLFIDRSVPELHSLHWELLRDPETGAQLASGDRIFFSRYLASKDFQVVRLRARGDLRALAAIANPDDASQYIVERGPTRPGRRQLAAIDVEAERTRIRNSLGDIPTTYLDSEGKVTFERLVEQVSHGYDILYLVCHGGWIDGQPKLWLENADGHAAPLPARELVAALNNLLQRPRLVVLASCWSAGTDDDATSADDGILSALGPRLAEIGIPAVVAMQGNVTMKTAQSFTEQFFAELQQDGQIDRAANVARGSVKARADSWMPTLFMRLKSGRIWSARGEGSFELWDGVLPKLDEGKCTPILGPEITESLLVSRRDIARYWARRHNFPMAPSEWENLAQVMQFVNVKLHDPLFGAAKVRESIRTSIQDRYAGELPVELQGPRAELSALQRLVWEKQCAADSLDPHAVLAQLDLPMYVTTNPDILLEQALQARGRPPVVEYCRWNADVLDQPSIFEERPDYRPSLSEPFVYHLFGHLDIEESLVVSEDDYFDYLIGITAQLSNMRFVQDRDPKHIPAFVPSAFADTALLFLGFQIDDWEFRVLFRSLLRLPGAKRKSRYPHVAVQIDPENSEFMDPEGARRYLEQYFERDRIFIYWGTARDFVAELRQRRPTPSPSTAARVSDTAPTPVGPTPG
jgi:hypothetical protein